MGVKKEFGQNRDKWYFLEKIRVECDLNYFKNMSQRMGVKKEFGPNRDKWYFLEKIRVECDLNYG